MKLLTPFENLIYFNNIINITANNKLPQENSTFYTFHVNIFFKPLSWKIKKSVDRPLRFYHDSSVNLEQFNLRTVKTYQHPKQPFDFH